MKTIISLATLIFLLLNAPAQQSDYSQLKADAERSYAQGSYARAHELYSKVQKTDLGPDEKIKTSSGRKKIHKRLEIGIYKRHNNSELASTHRSAIVRNLKRTATA